MNDLLTAEEAAELLRSNVNTLSFWRNQKKGPAWAKVGRRVVYRRSDIDAFVNEVFENQTAEQRRN